MRGNRSWPSKRLSTRGSIPAHAGKPAERDSCDGQDGVYPRACGETQLNDWTAASLTGLSPRMRGNRESACHSRQRGGSIPAHAGKPLLFGHPGIPLWVYPRACGETGMMWAQKTREKGLSPRMRGNQFLLQFHERGVGSIPAHAGKPPPVHAVAARGRVYPRACGETCTCRAASCSIWGLSPRMRGNPGPGSGAKESRGSIPAHAGKPSVQVRSGWASGVYPRACGETPPILARIRFAPGLSPRMRGNLLTN